MAGCVYNRGTKHAPNWWAKYKDHNGVWRAKATGQATKGAAETWLAAVVANIANGRVGIYEATAEQKEQATITVAELFSRFVAEYRPPKIKDADDYHAQTKAVFNMRILPTLGSRPASSIKQSDVEDLRDALLEGDPATDAKAYARGSVAVTMARLSKVYEWGKRKGIVACDNPVKGVDYPEAKSNLDYLSREEVIALLAYAEDKAPELHPMIATAIYCGLRKGELFGLRWRDVNFETSKVFVCRSYDGDTKSGEDRLVPLNPLLAPILRRWRERCPKTDADLVFPVLDVCEGYGMGRRRDMLGIEYHLRAAGCHVPQRPWHALRHTFASHFIMSGGNILTLQKLLGHADLTTTMIYAHLAPDFMAEEVARMSFVPKVATIANLDDHRRAVTR